MTTIKEFLQCETAINRLICINGWIKTNRKQQTMCFVTVTDGSNLSGIQVIVNNSLSNFSDVEKLTSGCSVSITGRLVKSPAKGQDVEIQAEEVKVLGWVTDPDTYPMPMKRHSQEHLRQHAHLRVRSNIGSAVARVRSSISKSIHDFFEQEKFHWVATPLITASDCEGAGEMFRVTTLDLQNIPLTDKGEVDFSEDFFGQQTGLTVSGQLNAETYACGMTKVYTFGPTFRAENSNTSRHLSEFWMVEPEIAFADMNDTIALSERMLKYVISDILVKCQEDMAFFDQFVEKGTIQKLTTFIESDFITVDYTDAIQILLDSSVDFEETPYWGIDLGSEHERYLAEKHFNAPIALVNYPKEIKSFYMRDNEDGKTVAAFDILAPQIGEIIGGSQREERYDVLVEKMEQKGLSLEEYEWYLDLRKYGTVPHSGFGLGLERLISYITGVSNVRDVIPFPRTPKNISF
jgi:asparaginyl-tRNA synthetase